MISGLRSALPSADTKNMTFVHKLVSLWTTHHYTHCQL